MGKGRPKAPPKAQPSTAPPLPRHLGKLRVNGRDFPLDETVVARLASHFIIELERHVRAGETVVLEANIRRDR